MGKQWKPWQTFIFLGSKITADGECSHESKRCLLLGRKAMTKSRQHMKKQRHYFADKRLSSQSCGISSSHVWMWELEIKKAECRRTDVFELCCWRRLVPWTARSKESILKEINPEYWRDWYWSWSSNTLATWYEELSPSKRHWCWERFKGRKRRGQQRMRWLDGITDWMDPSVSKL